MKECNGISGFMENTAKKILFAPMQGYTEAFYRKAHAKVIGGIDEYYAPFMRLEKRALRGSDMFDTEPERNRGIAVVPQVLVREAEEARILLGYLHGRGYRRIDFNFACPFPKVAAHGYGAGIIENPEAVEKVLEAAGEYPEVSFSVKIRSGLRDAEAAIRLLPVLNRFSLCKIVYHPRTGEQQYGGVPDYQQYKRFAGGCECPVVYNGDIRGVSDAIGYVQIMLGRGLLANPLLGMEIKGGKPSMEILRVFHQELMVNCSVYEQPLLKLKTVWDYFLPNAEKRLRKKVLKSRTLDEYREASEALFDGVETAETVGIGTNCG